MLAIPSVLPLLKRQLVTGVLMEHQLLLLFLCYDLFVGTAAVIPCSPFAMGAAPAARKPPIWH
jgi:hypothetical protein